MAMYQLDTKWGCGGVFTDENGIIRGGAPIFRKLIGQNVNTLIRSYTVTKL